MRFTLVGVVGGIIRALGRPKALRPSQLSEILESTMPAHFKEEFAGRVCWRAGNVLLFDPYQGMSAPAGTPVANEVTAEGGGVAEPSSAAEDDGYGLLDDEDYAEVRAASVAVQFRDDVEFNVTTGEVLWRQSMLPELFKAIAREFSSSDFRAIIALPEKRDNAFSSVGHYTTLVIDRSGGRTNAVVLDSQAMSGVKNFAFKTLLRHNYSNPDDGVHEKIKEIFGQDVGYSRQRYNHQAEVLDTSCGYFTAKMMKTVFEQSTQEGGLAVPLVDDGGEISELTVARWGVALTTLDVFLTEADITRMRAIVQDSVAQIVNIGEVENPPDPAEAVMRDGASVSPPPAEREALPEGGRNPSKTPD